MINGSNYSHLYKLQNLAHKYHFNCYSTHEGWLHGTVVERRSLDLRLHSPSSKCNPTCN